MSEGSIEALRARLERTIVRDRDLDREIAADWCAVGRETWEPLDRGRDFGAADSFLSASRGHLPARGHHQAGGAHNARFVGHLLLHQRDLAAE